MVPVTVRIPPASLRPLRPQAGSRWVSCGDVMRFPGAGDELTASLLPAASGSLEPEVQHLRGSPEAAGWHRRGGHLPEGEERAATCLIAKLIPYHAQGGTIHSPLCLTGSKANFTIHSTKTSSQCLLSLKSVPFAISLKMWICR